MTFRTALLVAGVSALALFQANAAVAKIADPAASATAQAQTAAPTGYVRTATLIELLVVIARSDGKTSGKISNADCASRSGKVVSKGGKMFCDIPDGKGSGTTKRQSKNGVSVAAGDVTGDGRADLVKGSGPRKTKR